MTLSNNTEQNRDGRLFGCGERAGESPQKAEDAVRDRLGEATEDHRPGRVLEGPTQRWYGHLVQIVHLLSSLSFISSPPPESVLSSEHCQAVKECTKTAKETCQGISTEHKEVHAAISKFGRAIDKVCVSNSPPSPLFYFLFGSAKIYDNEMLFTCPTLSLTLPVL